MDILIGQRQTYPLKLKACDTVFHEGAAIIVLNAASPKDASYKATFSKMKITKCQWESDADWRTKEKSK